METLFDDLQALNRARVSRDPRFDGKFFIAVKTTGIYCRPICPSRTCYSRNVTYYGSALAAAAAGYRPCLRCRPEAAPGTPAWQGTSAVVGRALRLIDEGALDACSVEQLADKLGLGPRHLHRLLVKHVGASAISLAQSRRLLFAKRLLAETPLSITQIALASGFRSLRRFNSAFREIYRRSPREVRREIAGSNLARADGPLVLKLAYRPPYDWEQVSNFLRQRAIPGIERVDADGYWRALLVDEAEVVVCVSPAGRENAIELKISGASASAILKIVSMTRRVFDLTADPAVTFELFTSDPLMAPLASVRPGIRIVGDWDPFESAARVVLEHGVNAATGRQYSELMVRKVGRRLKNPRAGLTHLFPDAKAVTAANLTDILKSKQRAETLCGVSREIVDGKLCFDLDPQEVVTKLRTIPGIDDVIAQKIALRALGEPDAFPAGDLTLRRAAAIDGALTASGLKARAEKWRPWRGYAAMHLWSFADPLLEHTGFSGSTIPARQM